MACPFWARLYTFAILATRRIYPAHRGAAISLMRHRRFRCALFSYSRRADPVSDSVRRRHDLPERLDRGAKPASGGGHRLFRFEQCRLGISKIAWRGGARNGGREIIRRRRSLARAAWIALLLAFRGSVRPDLGGCFVARRLLDELASAVAFRSSPCPWPMARVDVGSTRNPRRAYI
jgi:hypothetical protein